MSYIEPKIKKFFYSEDEEMNALCHKLISYRAHNRTKIIESLINDGHAITDGNEFDEAFTMYVEELLENDNWRDYALFKRVYTFTQTNNDWDRIEKNLQQTKHEIFKLIGNAWKPKTR